LLVSTQILYQLPGELPFARVAAWRLRGLLMDHHPLANIGRGRKPGHPETGAELLRAELILYVAELVDSHASASLGSVLYR
jgi:hypothetical protein